MCRVTRRRPKTRSARVLFAGEARRLEVSEQCVHNAEGRLDEEQTIWRTGDALRHEFVLAQSPVGVSFERGLDFARITLENTIVHLRL